VAGSAWTPTANALDVLDVQLRTQTAQIEQSPQNTLGFFFFGRGFPEGAERPKEKLLPFSV
jgi:hypothetical protein